MVLSGFAPVQPRVLTSRATDSFRLPGADYFKVPRCGEFAVTPAATG